MKSTVALVRCESYDRVKVQDAVRRAVDLIGGVSSLFKAAERIVLKPNLLSATPPEMCVTTHPSVFAAVAAVLNEHGVELSYGDSPAVGKCEPHARKAGIAEIAEKMSIRRADFDSGRTVRYTAARAHGTFPIAHGVLEADGVVSIPKLKTHNFTRITGAVKNQYGCVPGLAKAQYHARFLLPRDFSVFIADITGFVRPRLYVMDAVMAMEGNGPNMGKPASLGVILASTDPVAMDAIACALMKLPVEYVPTCAAGEEAGLGTCRYESISCVGDTLESLVNSSFKVSRHAPLGLTGTGVRRFLKEMMAPRPVLNARRCIRCGKCIEICPVEPKAVTWYAQDRSRAPHHEYSRCIRCFCCQEACPAGAISVKTGMAGRVVPLVVPPVAFVKTRLNRLVRWWSARPRNK